MSTTLAEVVQDLMAQGELSLDSDREIQGQVTQMSFTLALTLHQLETALQEFILSLKQTQRSDESAGEENGDKFGSRIAMQDKRQNQFVHNDDIIVFKKAKTGRSASKRFDKS